MSLSAQSINQSSAACFSRRRRRCAALFGDTAAERVADLLADSPLCHHPEIAWVHWYAVSAVGADLPGEAGQYRRGLPVRPQRRGDGLPAGGQASAAYYSRGLDHSPGHDEEAERSFFHVSAFFQFGNGIFSCGPDQIDHPINRTC